jgi:hypothetical protein
LTPESTNADVAAVTRRLAVSSAVWGVIVVLAGIASLLVSDSTGPDATRGQESLLRLASALLTMTVGVLFVVAGQRLQAAASRGGPVAWRSALLFVGLAIQAQIAVVLPAIATNAFMMLQGR